MPRGTKTKTTGAKRGVNAGSTSGGLSPATARKIQAQLDTFEKDHQKLWGALRSTIDPMIAANNADIAATGTGQQTGRKRKQPAGKTTRIRESEGRSDAASKRTAAAA
jgi:hypothetical protein